MLFLFFYKEDCFKYDCSEYCTDKGRNNDNHYPYSHIRRHISKIKLHIALRQILVLLGLLDKYNSIISAETRKFLPSFFFNSKAFSTKAYNSREYKMILELHTWQYIYHPL